MRPSLPMGQRGARTLRLHHGRAGRDPFWGKSRVKVLARLVHIASAQSRRGELVSAMNCTCGAHHSQEAHDLDDRRLLEPAVMRALFPDVAARRRFLAAVAASTAGAAVSTFFPFGSLQAMTQERPKPSKPELTIAFIRMTFATPLLITERTA